MAVGGKRHPVASCQGTSSLDLACVTAGPSRRLRDLTYHERRFIRALEDEAARFLIVGSWAVGLYGASLNPQDLDVLIGTETDNVRAFLRAWDHVEPVNYRRTLRGEPAPFQQQPVALGAGHADVLTTIRGVDFNAAWERRELRAFRNLQLPVLARLDLIAMLESSERPQDRERLAALLRQRHER